MASTWLIQWRIFNICDICAETPWDQQCRHCFWRLQWCSKHQGYGAKSPSDEVAVTEILFTDDMPITIHQERFLTNGKNKARFIQGLTGHLELAGIQVKHALADADTLTVLTATELSTNNIVVVVGTDVDLLILLIQLSKQDSQIYMYKPGNGKCPHKVFSISCIQQHLPEASSTLLFLHAMTGCDTITTSAL